MLLGGHKGNQIPFQWWDKHEAMFPTIGFLIHHILRIIGSQIEIKRIFFSWLESSLI
jgi:hypothetical protein